MTNGNVVLVLMLMIEDQHPTSNQRQKPEARGQKSKAAVEK
jgi:hypothetical protein